MRPLISLLTLGVDDLETSLRFYRDGLGWPTKGILGQEYEHGAVVFFDLHGGLKLALWARADLAHDARIPIGPRSSTNVCIAHNVATKEEVDTILEQARRAGAKIVKPGEKTFYGGYAGYFQDPDDHLWEVAWNPQLLPPE